MSDLKETIRPVSSANEALPFTDDTLKQTVIERFEDIVAHFADRTAINTQDKSLTYDELNRAANRAASVILDHKPDPEVPVVILLGDTFDILIAMLAVNKAGCFYTVIDSQTPPERLTGMLADAGPDLTVTDRQHRDHIIDPSLEVMYWEDIGDDLPDENPNIPVDVLSPESIYYSSGSTGQPKGIIWTHYMIMGTTKAYIETAEFAPNDRVLLVLSPAYGASSTIIWGALLAGGCLSLFDVKSKDLDELAEWIRTDKITVFGPSVTLLRHFIQSLDSGDYFPDVRMIVIGGESLYSDDVIRSRPHFPETSSIFYKLASQETSMMTYALITHDMEFDSELVPVGKIAPYRQAVIVDDRGREVPQGEHGELIIKSHFISPGYWNQPELNARHFSTDPKDPRLNIFQTRDMARIRPDGMLEFAGRKDLAVKIRGYRVVIGEVEQAIRRHPQIEDAAVWAHADHFGEKRLVGYYVKAGDVPVTASDLRDWLGELVTIYMIPTIFIELDELPMTITGKVDRQSLPVPSTERPAMATAYEGPRDGLEQELTFIWETVLGVHPVGIHDDFFDLGGHSLLALQLVTRIKQDLELDIPFDSLIETNTIVKMAELIRNNRTYVHRPLVNVQSGSKTPPLFCFHARGGHLMIYRALVRYMDPEQSVYGLQSQGLHGEARPLTTIQAMAEMYIQELKTVQPEGPYYLMGHSMGGLIAFEVALQLEQAGDTVARVIMIDTQFSSAGDEEKQIRRKQRGEKYRPKPTEAETRTGLERIRGALQDDIEALSAEDADPQTKAEHLSARLKHFWDWYIVRMAYRLVGKEDEFHKARWSPTRLVKGTNNKAASNYTPQRKLRGSVLFLRGQLSRNTKAADLWQVWADTPLDIVDFDIHHRGFIEEPHVRDVAALITEHIQA